MPRELKSQTQVLEELETTHNGFVAELEKDWLWITEPDLAPVHQVKGGCQCEECKERAVKREELKAIGFRFAFRAHVLPSGAESRWGHSCLRPTRFKKGKGKSNGQPVGQNQINGNESPQVDEDAAAFFEQV